MPDLQIHLVDSSYVLSTTSAHKCSCVTCLPKILQFSVNDEKLRENLSLTVLCGRVAVFTQMISTEVHLVLLDESEDSSGEFCENDQRGA